MTCREDADHLLVQRETGFALVSCLLFSLIIITIGMSFTYRVREELRMAQKMEDRLQADIKTWSALQEVLFVLTTSLYSVQGVPMLSSRESSRETPSSAQGSENRFLNLWGDEIPWEETVTVRLQDAASKVALIGGNRFLLQRLLEYRRVDPTTQSRILDSLEDWEDEDDFKRLNGAESWQYKVLNAGYAPRNFLCQGLDELLLIYGMKSDIFDLLRPDLILRGNGTFNYLNISPSLLKALLSPHLDLAEKFLEARQKGLLTYGMAAEMVGIGIGMDENFIFYPSNRIEITVEGKTGDAVSRTCMLYNRRETLKAPYQIEMWKK